MRAPVFAKRTESGVGLVVFEVIDTIFDEIRRLNLIHFELRFRAVDFTQQRFEQAVAFGCCVGGSHGGIGGGLGITGSGRERRRAGRDGQRESEYQVAVKSAHGFTSPLACTAVFAGGARSSKPGGGKSGGRSC